MEDPFGRFAFGVPPEKNGVDTSRDVLKKMSNHVGQLHVTPTIFREVKQLRPYEALVLGMIVVEPSLDMVAEASAKRRFVGLEL